MVVASDRAVAVDSDGVSVGWVRFSHALRDDQVPAFCSRVDGHLDELWVREDFTSCPVRTS